MVVPAWLEAPPLPRAAWRAIRRELTIEGCKWDPQFEDVSTLADTPLVLTAGAWVEISRLAVDLFHETQRLERALLMHPDAHRQLALPGVLRKALRQTAGAGAPAQPQIRVMRFDFHLTAAGWLVSEVNSDVPGGFIEASSFARLMAQHYGGCVPTGDPVATLVSRFAESVPPRSSVALVHATAYADDYQVMCFLARQFEAAGLQAELIAPDGLRWRDGAPHVLRDTGDTRCPGVLRFYPAEWLAMLPSRCGWYGLFGGTRAVLCNPAAAILTQSKRWPLAARALGLELPTWRERSPETRAVRCMERLDPERWVYKPAFGRVGDGVGVNGATSPAEWRQIRRAIRWGAGHWIAQRRFEALPWPTAAGPRYPALGVFVIDGCLAGVYGRCAVRPRIDGRAQDVAVLVESEPGVAARRVTETAYGEPCGVV